MKRIWRICTHPMKTFDDIKNRSVLDVLSGTATLRPLEILHGYFLQQPEREALDCNSLVS